MRFAAVPKVYRVLFNTLLLIALLALAKFYPHLGRAITKRGFFCDDASLMYPYHKSTITKPVSYTIAVFVPLLVIICVELLHHLQNRKQKRVNYKVAAAGTTENASNSFCSAQLLQQLYRPISIFLFGFACERIFKAVCKSTVGRLRPHFFEICQPVWANGSTCAEQPLPGRFVEHYSCLGGANVTASMLRGIHLAFPSGHSSLAFYGMVFLAFYLQRRLCVRRQSILRLLKPLLQLLCLLLACFVALSRFMDYKHHWSDVLGGALLGSFFAVFVWLAIERNVSSEPEDVQLATSVTGSACDKSSALSEVLAEVKCVSTE